MSLQRIVITLVAMLLLASSAQAEPIDFSSLNGADAADANGQDFSWFRGAQSGTVNVRATWPEVHEIGGAFRTPVRAPANFANPFTGTVTFTFDTPVEVQFLATFASMTRDGLDGGRFEQIRVSSPDAVQFQPVPGTTAVYSGVGASLITADDEFSPTPTLSLWGIAGTGPGTTYTLEYSGTTVGLSETFTVSVVPEPATLQLVGCAFAALAAAGFRVASKRGLAASKSSVAHSIRG